MTDKDLVFYVKLYVKPECIDEWKRAVTDIIEQMSREQAFVSCDLHQDAQQSNLFVLYERWNEPSVEAFLQHQDTPYRRDYEARLPALLERPREPTVLLPIGQWRK